MSGYPRDHRARSSAIRGMHAAGRVEMWGLAYLSEAQDSSMIFASKMMFEEFPEPARALLAPPTLVVFRQERAFPANK